MDEQQTGPEEFSSEPITVVIPRQTTKELAEYWRAELARQGLVEAKGGAS